jgi:hypothetical protein
VNYEPIKVSCKLAEGFVMRTPTVLDSLLAAVIAMREQLPTPISEDEIKEIPVPIDEAAGIRLCSSAMFEIEETFGSFRTRRLPIEEYCHFGRRGGSVSIASGPDKLYMMEYDYQFAVDDKVTWFALGDIVSVHNLLADVFYLGKHRSIGKGRIVEGSWKVESCKPWGEGFPVVHNGTPKRPLPLGWPGVATTTRTGYATLRPPYWMYSREEACFFPG